MSKRTIKAQPESAVAVNPYAHLSVCVIAHVGDRDQLHTMIATLPKGCEVIVVFNAQTKDESHIEDTDCKILKDDTMPDGTRMLFAEYEWVDFCFSKARNLSLGYATREWIIWLDADDILNPSQHTTLANLVDIPTGVGALMVTVAGMQPAQFKGDEVKHYAIPQPRLVRNGRGFQFEGRCHEQIVPCVMASQYMTQHSALLVTHLGYMATRESMIRRQKRNVDLLARQVTEWDYPDEFFTKFLQRDLTNYLKLKENA